MSISEARARRIAQRIQQDLAQLLRRRAADPRLELVTVTGVEVDRELAFATIYVNAAEAADRQKEILEALRGAAGFLRSQLASEIELRTFPRLRFRWDETPDRSARIDDLLAKLRRDEGEDPA
ncbi:MAG TPA: 30S ribosome-binding factor RbfA [Anaerolineales bacterium]